MAQANTVFLVQIHLKKKIEDSPEVIAHIGKSILHSVLDATDNPMTLSFVVVARGNAQSILKRYEGISNHEGVHNVRVLTTNPNNASSLGMLDPIGPKLEMAWRRVSEGRQTEKLIQRNGASKRQVKRALRKSGVSSRTGRKQPQNADK
ncbi:hypothetical protein GCM10011309_03000 [Litorimonas cladophorae]|uniref:Uncharacterized protein n=2 Tax=Litorimonas cladophorae TaxID=1220491 RepID=A0A918NB35_9PROT|nr:hypothetical protein GCM10011309_03000 [Litorimonas cladophorae]